MDASELREWIAIFQMELLPDGQGGAIEKVPADLVADIPAKVRQPSGGQVWASDQVGDRVRYEITIRWDPGITTAYRVMWRDQFFDIVTPNNLESADKWLQLTCERREMGQQ
jgi:head-tail adaptor